MPPSAIHARLGAVGLVALMLAADLRSGRAQDGPAAAPARLTLGGPAPRVRTETGLRAFLDELEAQELMVGEALALEIFYQWKGETHHRAAAFGRLWTDLTTRRDYAAVIDRWRGRVKDGTLARRLDLHHRDFLASRVDPRLPVELVTLQSSIQDTVSAFRFDLDGQQITRTGLGEVIDTSADRARRERAYRATRQIAAHTRSPILRAMGLIDRIGRGEGFPNGAAAGLVNSSLEAARVLRDLDAFEVATRAVYLATLERARADLDVPRLEPWDIVVRLRRTMLGLGFGFDSLPITVEVREVPTGGITFPIRPPFEARLLSNPFTGSEFYSTLFHEYGHALNFTLRRPDLPAAFFRGDETPLGEGVAETLGLLALDRGWLTRIASVPSEQARALERAGKMEQLLWLRGTTEHFFAPGASIPWQEKIRRATGQPLSTAALGRYFADAGPAARH